MSELERQIDKHSMRMDAIESEMGDMKVEMGKISTTLEFQEDRSKERFEALNTAQIQMMDIMKAKEERDEARAREAREYRERREQFERETEIQRQNWVRSLFTPQTIIMGLIVIGSILGIRMVDMQGVSQAAGLTPKEQPTESP